MARAIKLKEIRAIEVARIALGWGWYLWRVDQHALTLIRWDRKGSYQMHWVSPNLADHLIEQQLEELTQAADVAREEYPKATFIY